jgi:hypothetical protein
VLVAVIDWTNVVVSGIVGLPAIIAAVYAGRVHRAVKTPSGKSLGEVSEYAHDTAIANNLLLSKQNGPTKPADRETIQEEGSTPPRIPTEARKEV